MLFALLILLSAGHLQVAAPAGGSPFLGTWVLNLSKSKVPPDFAFRDMTLQFAVVFDTVTIGNRFATASGQTQTGTELFHMDGKEHPGTLNAGVLMTGRWIDARTITTAASKDGHDVGAITYQVSSDGKTLTQKYSMSPGQELVFDRK